MKLQAFVVGLAAVALTTVGLSGQAATGQAANLSKVAKLRNPAGLTETAPAKYQVTLDTSKGPIVIEVTRDWAPLAADRFFNLVKNGFYDDVRFFRVVPNFMVQFGMNGNPAITQAWSGVPMKDEPTKQGNKKGYVTFARTSAPNSRGTQLFINYKDNNFLDAQGFAAFGQVIKGMDVAEKINAEYAERPEQGRITSQGNAYLTQAFPRLDYVKTATITN